MIRALASLRPGPRLPRALGGWLALALLASAAPALRPLWAGVGLGLALALGVEAAALLRRALPALRRQLPAVMALGNWHEVRLRLDHHAGGRLRGELFDHVPEVFAFEHLPARFDLAPGGWAELGYRCRPDERGLFAFPAVDLLLDGPLGLLRRHARAALEDEIKVYPDFRAVARYALLAHDQQRDRMGIHLQRRRGEGTEFHQLREYRPGDSVRRIDWKATARRRTLMAKEYRDEADQRLLLLLDCGRRMHTRDGALAHFDHVLNATLLLAHVALKQGDAVGLQAFSGADRWLPPRKGPAAMAPLLDGVFDLRSSLAASDYTEAARRVAARQRRRAFVVLLTNLRDEDDADLRAAVGLLRTRHLVLVASLREPALDEVRQAPVQGFEQALRRASVERYLRARRLAFERLRGLGALTLDVRPHELPVALVNRYLEVKRAGML